MEWALPAVVAFCVLVLLIALAAVVLAGIAAIYAHNAIVDVKALQNSTHNIQYVAAEPPRSGDDDLDAAMAAAERRDYQHAGDIHDASEPLM